MTFSLAFWSQFTTWGLSFVWFLIIIRIWFRAKSHAMRLKEHAEILSLSYQQNIHKLKPFLDLIKYLQAQGWQASDRLSRYDMISFWRAIAQTDKQKMSSYIEMMPQIGLLGTVLSLFLSAFVFEFNIAMLGLALVTTAFGLMGALWARTRFELPTEQYFFNIIELLQNDEVITQLLQNIPLVHAEQKPQASSPTGESFLPKESGIFNAPETIHTEEFMLERRQESTTQREEVSSVTKEASFEINDR